MANNKIKNDYVLYSINVEDVQDAANDTIDRDLTDDEIKKVEERIGNYLPNPNESEQDFRFTNYDLGFGI